MDIVGDVFANEKNTSVKADKLRVNKLKVNRHRFRKALS